MRINSKLEKMYLHFDIAEVPYIEKIVIKRRVLNDYIGIINKRKELIE
jgi:hypothetical protein